MALGERLTKITAANPDLANDPETAVAMASSSLPDNDLMRLSETQRGQANTQFRVGELSKLPAGDQWAQWKMLDSDSQDLFKKFGYVPKPYEDKSILRKVTKGLGAALNVIDPAEGFQQIAEDTFKLMQVASDKATHGYRFSREVLFDGKGDSWSDFAAKWAATNDGESYWREDVKQDIRKRTGAEHFGLAVAIAGGDTEAEYLETLIDRSDPNWENELIKIHGIMLDPKINDAITRLTAAKITPGRDMVSLINSSAGAGFSPLFALLHPNEIKYEGSVIPKGIPVVGGLSEGEFLSGSVDGAFRWYTDPTLGAGKAMKIYKLAKYGIRGDSLLAMTEDINQVRRAYHAGQRTQYGLSAERIAHAFKTDNLAQLVREMPQIQHGLRAMEKWHTLAKSGLNSAKTLDTVDGVFDFYVTGAGTQAITAGRFGTRAFKSASVHALPMATKFSQPWGVAKLTAEKIIDKGRFGSKLIDGDTSDVSKIALAAVSGKYNPVRITADGIHHMTNMIPKVRHINPDAPDSTELIRQVLAFHMPLGYRDDMFNEYMLRSGNMAFKKQNFDLILKANAEAAGMLEHEKGRNFIARYLNRSQHSYAANGLDHRILPNGEEGRAAIYPNQFANAFSMPSFREQMEVARNAGQYLEMTQNAVDFTMSKLWKPSVLLRVGFIPRAFGEEMLWSIGKYGTALNFKGHMMTLASKEFDEPLPLFKPMLGLTRNVAKFAPGITKYPMTGIDIGAQFMFKMMTRAIRGTARAFTDEYGFFSMRHYAEHQGMTGISEGISATNMTGLATPNVADDMNLMTIQKPDGSGGFKRISLEVHGRETLVDLKDDPWATARLMRGMEELGEHDIGRIFADAAARWVKPEEMKVAAQEAYRLGLIDDLADFDKLRKLIPEDMPPEWERYLTQDGFEISKARQALIEHRQRQASFTNLGDEERSLRAHETISEVPPTQDVPEGLSYLDEPSDLEFAERLDPNDLEWYQTEGATPDPGAFVDPDDLDDTLRRLTSGESAATPPNFSDEGVTPLELRSAQPRLAGEAEREVDALLSYIQSLPPNQRRSLFSRHGAMDRHVRSQSLADRKLVDPNFLNDDMLDELATSLNKALGDEGQRLGAQVNDVAEHNLHNMVSSAITAGADEEVLATELKALYAKWHKRGYQGILHPNGTRATLWDNNGVAVRGLVAKGEREVQERFYQAMYAGDKDGAQSAIQEMLSSRWGRGDYEDILQKADVGQGLKDGTPLAVPIAEGTRRVYTITVPRSAAGAHGGFVGDAQMADTDTAFLAMSGQQAIDFGVPGIPEQAWFTSDWQQVKRLKADMESRLGGTTTPSIGWVDVSTENFNKGRVLAREGIAGGLADEADVRQLATVFLDPADKARIQGLTDQVVEFGEYNGGRFPVSQLKAQLAEVQRSPQAIPEPLRVREEKIASLTKAIDEAIASPGVERGEVLEELANTNMQDMLNTFSQPFDNADPRDLRSLAHELTTTGEVSWATADKVPSAWFPSNVSLPRLVATDDASWLENFTQNRFDEIGRAGNAMVRHPLFMALYAEALQGMGALRDSITDPKVMKNLEKLSAKYGLDRDAFTQAWMRLPDEVRNAANPKAVAELHGIPLPAAMADITPKDAQALNRALEHSKYVEKHVSDIAKERAERHMIPYLDDHKLRSQFQERHRHLIPFQFAEEQFIKRWGKTVIDNPELLRKAQLTYQGFKHVGVISQNEYGEDVWVFPGSELIMKATSKMLQTITGQPIMLPVGNPFTGQVKYTFAGSDRFGVPAVGPLAGIATAVTKKFFPELAENELLKNAESVVYGQRGMNRTVSQHVVPSSLLKMYQAVTHDPESDAQMSSAMMEAGAYMEAAGLAPAEDADAQTKKIYQQRLRNHSRMVLLMRGALSFFSPASLNYTTPDSMSPRFKELLRDMPIEEAVAQLIEEDPDALPWTIFDTKSVSGAPLPATDKAYAILKNNEQFFEKYNKAGPWFLPQSSDTDAFSRQAYYQQMDFGLRVRKQPQEFQDDIDFAQAAELYFPEQERKELALDSWGDRRDPEAREAKRVISETWRIWKEEYFKLHPVFATELENPAGKQRRRDILSQMEGVLADPSTPKVPHLEPMRVMVTEYRRMQSALDGWKSYNTKESRQAKDTIKETFSAWSRSFTLHNPEIKAFYNRVIAYEIGE